MKQISSFFRLFHAYSIRRIALCAMLLSFLCACGSGLPINRTNSDKGSGAFSSKSDPSRVSDSKQNLLIIRTPFPENVYTPLIREFERRTGIFVEIGEDENADLVLGGDSFLLRSEEKRYQRVIPFSASPIVIVYNPRLIQMTPPTGWLSLYDPMWSGRIAFASPTESAVSVSALCAMCQALTAESIEDPDALSPYGIGADPAKLVLTWLTQLERRTAPSEDAVITSIADGSCYAGITSEAHALLAKEAGLDVTIIYPIEGTTVMTSCTAIVNGCAHPENARKFEEFLQSDDVQRFLPDHTGNRSPYRASDGQPLTTLRPLSQITLLPDSAEWSSHQWKSLLSAWKTAVSPDEDAAPTENADENASVNAEHTNTQTVKGGQP